MFNTCRFCKDWRENKYGDLIKYGVRHYAHADCGLKAKGTKFFDALPEWRLQQFPIFAAKDTGFLPELQKRTEGFKVKGVDYE